MKNNIYQTSTIIEAAAITTVYKEADFITTELPKVAPDKIIIRTFFCWYLNDGFPLEQVSSGNFHLNIRELEKNRRRLLSSVKLNNIKDRG